MNESNNALPRVALLLDDNLLSGTRVNAQLEKLGYRVVLAKSLAPETASSLETEEAPNLVVINLGSRFIAGVELVSACRARYPEAIAIGFCGHREVDIWKAARQAGIHKILTNDQAYSELAANL